MSTTLPQGDDQNPTPTSTSPLDTAHSVRQDYQVQEMTKALFDDAGIDWPDWVQNPNEDDVTVEDNTIPPVPAPAPVTPPTPTPTPPSVVRIGDRDIPADQAQALLAWQDFLANNPDRAAQVIAIARGDSPQSSPTPVPTPDTSSIPPSPTVPDGFDLDDPRDKFIFDKMNELTTAINKQSELTTQQITRSMEAQARADMHEAMVQFKTNHPQFDATDLEAIRNHTAGLGIVGQFVAQSPNDAPAGIVKALEAGMWMVESARAKLISGESTPTPNPQQQADQARQSALSKLSGSATSTARTEPAPRLDTDHSMREAIAKVVEPMFNNN